MKRNVMSMVLGLALVMMSGTTAMAAEAPQEAELADVKFAVTASVDTAVGEVALEDGLFVSLFEGTDDAQVEGDRALTGYTGIVSLEDMERLTEALELSDADREALLEDYAANRELQDERNALFAAITEDMTQEEQNVILDQAEALDARMLPIFTGKVLDKAVELNILGETTMCFVVLPSEEGDFENTFIVKDGAADLADATYSTRLK